jgi:hypothetical protein
VHTAGPKSASRNNFGTIHKASKEWFCPPWRKGSSCGLSIDYLFSTSRRSLRYRQQRPAGQPLLHQPGNEFPKRRDVLADACHFESVHVGRAVFDRDDRPGIAAGRHGVALFAVTLF